MTQSDPADAPPTLPVERTALSWIRTALGLLAATVGMARLTAGSAPRVVLPLLGVALVLCAWVLIAVALRGARVDSPAPHDGRFPAALTLATLVLAATAAAVRW